MPYFTVLDRCCLQFFNHLFAWDTRFDYCFSYYLSQLDYRLQLFEKVEVTKPVASRSTSAEIYVIGFRYKAPAKIDPRLLDIKHLFQGAVDPPKVS